MTTSSKPLAERLRPSSLDDFVGQQHLVGEGQVLRKIIESGKLPSMIFWGPPGVGKTTLARIISESLDLPFYTLSAVDSGVKEVRKVIDIAQKHGNAILFIDEIHRFSKSQQDSLLGAVERGTIYLIGATTENPSFEVISPLLSRSQVYILEPLGKADLARLLDIAMKKDDHIAAKEIVLEELDALFKYGGGDGRKLLNLFELIINATDSDVVVINNENVAQIAQSKMAIYDKSGEQHYDIISAFIKSIRGSDCNAGLYYLARMVVGGEDPKFIARRLLILAAEDIGNANPTALVLAQSCFQAVHVIGYPECELILSQTVIYLANSPKSNSAKTAIAEAKRMVRKTGDLPVPLHIRNAPTKLMKELDYGKAYLYAHSYPGNFVDQEFLPSEISGTRFYEPGLNPREEKDRLRLRNWWKEKYGY